MTKSLQMIRAEINVRDFQRWMGMRRLQDPDHAMHCLLVESFGKDLAPKPFRVMMPRGGRNGCLYGYAPSGADALREAAGMYACPLQAGIIPADRIESKPMPLEWQNGKKRGFEVRIRPMVRHARRAACKREGDSCYKLRLPRKCQCDNCRPNPEQDAFLFAKLLANGIGRHCAYGYGMLLLKPAH